MNIARVAKIIPADGLRKPPLEQKIRVVADPKAREHGPNPCMVRVVKCFPTQGCWNTTLFKQLTSSFKNSEFFKAVLLGLNRKIIGAASEKDINPTPHLSPLCRGLKPVTDHSYAFGCAPGNEEVYVDAIARPLFPVG